MAQTYLEAALAGGAMLPDEAATLGLGSEMAAVLPSDAVVLLEGPLGAGKTTLVRGLLAALGHTGPVRSPTFTLLQVFDGPPRVAHADLYRVASAQGVGLEDELGEALCLVEWPDRLGGLVDPGTCWRVRLQVLAEGRAARVWRPGPG